MAKTARTADLNGRMAANLFVALNPMEVEYFHNHPFFQSSASEGGIIVTDVDPNDLTYPEGWYFAKGTFRNKHNTTTGMYDEIPIIKSDGGSW